MSSGLSHLGMLLVLAGSARILAHCRQCQHQSYIDRYTATNSIWSLLPWCCKFVIALCVYLHLPAPQDNADMQPLTSALPDSVALNTAAAPAAAAATAARYICDPLPAACAAAQ
jgi:hypothetical protein